MFENFRALERNALVAL